MHRFPQHEPDMHCVATVGDCDAETLVLPAHGLTCRPDTVFVGLFDLENQLDMQEGNALCKGSLPHVDFGTKMRGSIKGQPEGSAKREVRSCHSGTINSNSNANKTLVDFAEDPRHGQQRGMGHQHDGFLDDTFAEKLLKKLPGSLCVLTYLVNGIESAGGKPRQSMVRRGRMIRSARCDNQWLADGQRPEGRRQGGSQYSWSASGAR